MPKEMGRTVPFGFEMWGCMLVIEHVHVFAWTRPEFQNTNVAGVYALGDVCGKVQLTPMAIAAGRRLADRLFGGIPDAKVRPISGVVDVAGQLECRD
jgi:hypothetical protein